jgi:hypothetical protein
MNEPSLRKPEFSEGCAVELADGQTWTFPKPRFRVTPVDGPDGRITTYFQPSYGDEFDRTMAIFLEGQLCTTGELFEVRFRCAADLLRRNYDLSTADLAELLVHVDGDAASEQRWQDIDAILVGSRPKKPSPDGSDTAS